MKKGFIFSMDAFLAIIIFTFVIFFIYAFSISFPGLNQQYFFSEDLLNTIAEVKIDELNLASYPEINKLILDKKINNTDVALVEQIVTFRLNNDKESAEIIINDILNDKILSTTNEKLKTSISISDIKIYGQNPLNVDNLLTRTRLAIGKK